MLYYIKKGAVLGSIVKGQNGCRFYPYIAGRRSSRRNWPTPDEAIKGRVSGGRFIQAADKKEAARIAVKENDGEPSEIPLAEESY